MKKLALLVLLLVSVLCFVACGDSEPEAEGVFYTVTFVQDGQENVTKKVKEGETLTDVPVPVEVPGYDIVWDITDFSGIDSDLTVHTIKTNKTFTITYDANGGTVASATQKVSFDSYYTLLTPMSDTKTFVSWKNGETAVAQSGKWSITGDVTLVAEWSDVAPTAYTISFVQDGWENINKTLDKGEFLTEIPVPNAVYGYDVVWSVTDFSTIQVNTVVTAVKTAMTFTITYNANGGNISETSQNVTFDSEYTLITPTREGFSFVCWKEGNKAVDTDGVWKIGRNIALTAEWFELPSNTFTITFDLGERKDDSSVYISAYSMQAKSEDFTLLRPVCDNYDFICWKIKGTDTVVNDDSALTMNLELVAVWAPCTGFH